MQSKKTLSWQIGAAYIGTVIGAGFATGQEILQFFTCYGTLGIFLAVLSGLFFMLLGYGVFYISRQLKAYTYRDFIYALCGSRLGFFYDIIITVFLFLGTSIMFSGSGAIFEENLGLPAIVGVVAIAVLTLVVVLQAVKGILRINSLIVPILTTVIAVVLCITIAGGSLGSFVAKAQSMKAGNPIKPIFLFLFYCSYNIVLSIGVLTAFPREVKELSVLRRGAFIGGMGLLLLAFSLNICLLLNAPEIFNYSIPMVYVVSKYSLYIKYAVMLCIWCEVFSTAVSNVFSLSSRLAGDHPGVYSIVCLGTVICCIPLALVDFKKLVGFFYPLFGALSILLILKVLYFFFEQRLKKAPKNSKIIKKAVG